MGHRLDQFLSVHPPGDTEIGREVEGGDRQAVDSFDLADLLDVVDGTARLHQQRADRLPSSSGQVVEYADAPSRVGDEGSPTAPPTRWVPGEGDAVGGRLGRRDEWEDDPFGARVQCG